MCVQLLHDIHRQIVDHAQDGFMRDCRSPYLLSIAERKDAERAKERCGGDAGAFPLKLFPLDPVLMNELLSEFVVGHVGHYLVKTLLKNF